VPTAKSRIRSRATAARVPSGSEHEDARRIAKFEFDIEGDKTISSNIGTNAWWRWVLDDKQPAWLLYETPPMLRILLVRRGVPAETVSVIAHAMGVARDNLYTTLGLTRATAERKIRGKERLSQDHGERVMGIARLIGQVHQIVRESGNPEGFEAARWVADWLERPLPALGGTTPGMLLDTAEGRDIVSGLIGQMQSSAYA
jgi:putative toxin-antitoxin system antitoxin component (TIGR02293 family)